MGQETESTDTLTNLHPNAVFKHYGVHFGGFIVKFWECIVKTELGKFHKEMEKGFQTPSPGNTVPKLIWIPAVKTERATVGSDATRCTVFLVSEPDKQKPDIYRCRRFSRVPDSVSYYFWDSILYFKMACSFFKFPSNGEPCSSCSPLTRKSHAKDLNWNCVEICTIEKQMWSSNKM